MAKEVGVTIRVKILGFFVKDAKNCLRALEELNVYVRKNCPEDFSNEEYWPVRKVVGRVRR
jgi:hypothetical protein